MIYIKIPANSAIERGFVKKIAARVLKKEGIRGNINIGIVFVGPDKMRRINKLYGGKDCATDVLSFANREIFLNERKDGIDLGDVIICLSEVRKQAKEFRLGLEKELAHVVAHGILHLLGWDHKNQSQEIKMHAREEEITA